MAGNLFPAPREVDRYLYRAMTSQEYLEILKFPASLEVDRELYTLLRTTHRNHQNRFRPLARLIVVYTNEFQIKNDKNIARFPAPREVDR